MSATSDAKKTFQIKPKKQVPWERPAHWKIPVTLGEEVEQAMAEWYGCRGLTMPAEEVGIGARIDAEEKARHDAEEAEYFGALKAQEDAPAGAKPEFGTPEFWAWARKRKKEKDAEREAQGLPPLPSKKEAEAAKVAKAAEKLAEKEKKAAEKAEKEAAKAAKEAEKASKAAAKAAKAAAKK